MGFAVCQSILPIATSFWFFFWFFLFYHFFGDTRSYSSIFRLHSITSVHISNFFFSINGGFFLKSYHFAFVSPCIAALYYTQILLCHNTRT